MKQKRTEAEIDGAVNRLMELAEEAAIKFRGGGPPNYPPGIDPVRMRDLQREALREAIRGDHA